MKTFHIKTLASLLVLLLLSQLIISAQEVDNDFQLRTYATLSFKPIKKIKISFSPEFRFSEGNTMDKTLLETEVVYKPVKFFSIGGNYRFIINPRDENPTEYLHGFGLSATFKKEVNRFEPSFRLSFSNYADDQGDLLSAERYLRYKFRLEYDIRKCKLTPLMAVELFHQVPENQLYKIRYTVGADYKLFKNNYISLRYKLDYFLKAYRNKHILSIGYKLKL